MQIHHIKWKKTKKRKKRLVHDDASLSHKYYCFSITFSQKLEEQKLNRAQKTLYGYEQGKIVRSLGVYSCTEKDAQKLCYVGYEHARVQTPVLKNSIINTSR